MSYIKLPPPEFRQDINGLRAWAVAAVVLYHFQVPGFNGGFVGVDVFFVISGYLMTKLIVGRLPSRFSLIDFYIARGARIIPALVVLCAALLGLGWFFLPPAEFSALGKSVKNALGFYSNYSFFKEAGYFDVESHYKPLLHTWSLSVEWQFYLLLPLAVCAAWRLWPDQAKIRSLFIAACLASFAYGCMLTLSNASASFYLLPGRAWEMLVGGIVYLAPLTTRLREPRFAKALEAIGFATIGGSMIVLDTDSPWPGWRALLPVMGAACVLWAHRPESPMTAPRFAQWLGKCSYSVYLWHWPVVLVIFFANRLSDPLTVAIGILASLIAGQLSYIAIERPAASFVRGIRWPTRIAALAAPVLLVGVTGMAINLKDGFPDHMAPAYKSVAGDITMAMADNGFCFYSVDTIKSLPIGDQGFGCTLGNQTPRLKTLLFGDSYAGHAEPFWDAIGKKEKLQINAVTTNWCYPGIGAGYPGPKTSRAFEQCRLNRNFFEHHVKDYDVVVLGGAWHDVIRTGNLSDLESAMAIAAKSARLVVILPSPMRYDTNIGKAFLRSFANGVPFDITRVTTKADELAVSANAAVKAAALRYPNVMFLPREDMYPASGTVKHKGTSDFPINYDANHINIIGAQAAAKMFQTTKTYDELHARLTAIPGRANDAGFAPR